MVHFRCIGMGIYVQLDCCILAILTFTTLVTDLPRVITITIFFQALSFFALTTFTIFLPLFLGFFSFFYLVYFIVFTSKALTILCAFFTHRITLAMVPCTLTFLTSTTGKFRHFSKAHRIFFIHLFIFFLITDLPLFLIVFTHLFIMIKFELFIHYYYNTFHQ